MKKLAAGLIIFFLCTGLASLSFAQSDFKNVQDRVSVDYGAEYVWWSGLSSFEVGSLNNEPYLVFRPKVQNISHDGKLAFKVAPSLSLEFIGNYQEGNDKGKLDNLSPIEPIIPTVTSDNLALDFTGSPLILSNSFTYKQSIREYSIRLKADYQLKRILFRPGIGMSLIRQRSSFFLNQNAGNSFLHFQSINYHISSGYWGPEADLDLTMPVTGDFSIIAGGKLQILDVISHLEMDQNIPPFDIQLIGGAKDRTLTYTTKVYAGVVKKINQFTLSWTIGLQYWSYLPEVSPNIFSSDPGTTVQQDEAIQYYTKLQAGIQF